MDAVELAGLDVAKSDSVELLASDPSMARALFDGVPVARLLARTRAARDEHDVLVGNESQPSFSFDAIVARVCQTQETVARVRAAIARQAHAASVEGPLASDDVTIATLVFAVGIAPAPDASMAEAFIESTTKGLRVAALLDMAQAMGTLREGAAAYDRRLTEADPRGPMFEACIRLVASGRVGPVPVTRWLEASRKLARAGITLLQPTATLFPSFIEAELPRRARRMVAVERAALESIARRDPRDLAATLARIEPVNLRDTSPPGTGPASMRLDKLLADIGALLAQPVAPVLAVSLDAPELDAAELPRASWHPQDWSSPQTPVLLATSLERGNSTVPRALAFVQRGGDEALDAIGAEMLNVEAHPFASVAFAEILARRARARDVTRLITYFAIAPDLALAARALATCTAPDLPVRLRGFLESMLPQDGSSVPMRTEPTSSAARLMALVEALRPHRALFDAARPLLERIRKAG